MRQTVFLMLGMLIGGMLATLALCALQLGARYERLDLENENDEARR